MYNNTLKMKRRTCKDLCIILKQIIHVQMHSCSIDPPIRFARPENSFKIEIPSREAEGGDIRRFITTVPKDK